MKITSVFAREILDSRGNPTIEVEVKAGKAFGRAAAPSGASTGMHEALELRDGGKRYLGKGVRKAVDKVNKIISPALKKMDVAKQSAIDKKMIGLDGTENKMNLGGNAMVATSMAVLRAAANSRGKWLYEHLGGKKLPKPMFNILNGGKHAGGELSIQEFMIIPSKAKSFSETLRQASEIYHVLGKRLVKKYGPGARNVGDEGGFAPQMKRTHEALDAIMEAINEAGYKGKVNLAMDAAASSFYSERSSNYILDGEYREKEEMLDFYVGLSKSYPIVSIEDPFYEEDFDSFAALTKKIGKKVQIVGDDLLVTNVKRIKTGIKKKSMNALLLKVNQIGTVTEAMEAAKLCRKNKMNVVVSHRSGETEDSFIADFSVGLETGQIKTGAPARGERTSKYNQLLRIEERLKG